LERGSEDFAVELERVRHEVLDGLSAPQKRLSGTYLWDACGSELFDRICGTEDYYLTRAETALLAAAAPEVAALTGPGATLVEYGSGASRKVRLLLEALSSPVAYVAIDVSASFLAEAAARIAMDHPGLAVLPLAADYTRPIVLPERPEGPVLGFFPGSTIGNFKPEEVTAFLARARATLGAGRLLIGHDPTRDPALLLAAYGGAEGLMPALHLNVLSHLGRLLAAPVDVGIFRHEVRIGENPFRVEAHLVARRPVRWQIGEHKVEIAEGETIHTDTSHKMTPEEFLALAARPGGVRSDAGRETTTRSICSGDLRRRRQRQERPNSVQSTFRMNRPMIGNRDVSATTAVSRSAAR
jgi:dimethylhistidine N-methyltransferase